MTRLDAALFAAGYASSRTHARRIVEEGRALVNGTVARRASLRVLPGDDLDVVGVPEGGEWASRAALKLEGVLAALVVEQPSVPLPDFPGVERALDVGASTGGFTDVLLRRGVHHVVAIDVGHGQMLPRLASHPRVTNMEGTDARSITSTLVGEVDLVVSDVSFISLTLILPAVMKVARVGTPLLLMVKPQFEVGRARVPKSGVVSDPFAWRDAVWQVTREAARHGARLHAVVPSPVAGQDGNREFFVYLEKTARSNNLTDREYGMIEDRVRAADVNPAS